MNKKLILTNLDLDEIKDEITQSVIDAINTQQSRQPKPQEDELIGRAEAAKMLKISTVTLWTRMKEGKIPYRQMGRRILFSKQELLESTKGGNHER